ncbi:MAG: hypothetical protein JWP11_2746 [Frankiales bacterium]|nr:hypothetical protein [Frankiales bacterium]
MTAPTRTAPAPGARCAVHPSRPAVDACPVCGRPRCGADAAAPVRGCLACTPLDSATAAVVAPPTDVERLVRATLAAYAVALLGGPVGSEYVGATVFEYLGPFVVGVICGGAATRAAGTDGRDRIGRAVRGLSALLAVLSVAFSFVLEESRDALSVSPQVLLPYAAAVAGAILWTIPPRPGRGQRQGLSTDV